MVQGNFEKGEYFLDCVDVSQPVARAIFGAWIAVCFAMIAVCLRSVYHSWIKRRIFNRKPSEGPVSLWQVSPAATPYDAFECRKILIHALLRGEIFFSIASVACIMAAIISAASTSIANHTIVSNVVSRKAFVPGVLVTPKHNSISGAVVQIAARAAALTNANAPLDELFDFAPNDTSGWVYVAKEWNNTWKGRCSYHLYPAVDLVVFTTNSSAYQDQVPRLGSVLPSWATVDPTRQGSHNTGFYDGSTTNSSGSYRDNIITYVFGSIPYQPTERPGNPVNISLANILLHNVGRTEDNDFVQTAFKSDVHVAECTFTNVHPEYKDAAGIENGYYANAASNVASLYERSVVESSIRLQPVIQPTAQQMLRNWQAFMSVRDSQFPHPKQRLLSVSRPVVQIRLSVLLTTTSSFLAAIAAAVLGHFAEPNDGAGRSLKVPRSQFDWTVQAAREYLRGRDEPTWSSSAFAAQHDELRLVASTAFDGRLSAHITSPRVPIFTSSAEPVYSPYHNLSPSSANTTFAFTP